MRQFYTILTFALSTALLSACTSDSDKLDINTNQETVTRIDFPEADESRDLTTMKSPIAMARVVFTKAGRDVGMKLGRHIEITDKEYNEIATFTTTLVEGSTNELQKYSKIFNWITSNIKYEYQTSQRPYDVFTVKKGICQGYADLLNVMCHSQGIPCVTVNGMLLAAPGGGHAWNYLNCDGVWYVSDPTNGGRFRMSATDGSYDHLYIMDIQATLFEDDYCTYNFSNMLLNVESIKDGHSQVVIPYSVNGIRINSVNPNLYISTDAKELYLGKNITSLDREDYSNISNIGKSIEAIVVDPENSVLESFSNVVYRNNQLYLIAPGVKNIELKPIDLDKESKLKNLEKLETIIFAPGTKQIGSWAVEKCPKLHTAFVPYETTVEENAFSGVASNFRIVRGDYTNIPQIKE